MERLWAGKLAEATVQETAAHPDLRGGPTLGRMAEARGVTALQVMVELALAEDLATRFRVVMANDDDDQIAALLNRDRFLLGLSDAGAHATQLCDANFTTYLLSHWVRDRRDLTLEHAVCAPHRTPGRGVRARRTRPDRRRLGGRSGGLRSRYR